MKRTTLLATVLAVIVLTTGFAAAVPGNVPGSAAADESNTDTGHPADERADRSGHADAADRGADYRGGQGPNVDLPDQVPDHVSAIHDRISSFLNGGLEGSLGEAVSEVTPGDDTESEETTDDGDDDTESEKSGDE